MPTSPTFWNRIAKRYARQPVADEASYQRKLEITRALLRPDMKLLEFGCGTGSTALIHAPHVAHIRAIDLSDRMIEIAREKARDLGAENVTFEVATIEDVDVPDGSYDMVLALSILHLLDDKEAAIEKVERMLKPGGWFVSSTACIGSRLAWLRFLLPIGAMLGLLPHVSFFTEEELERAMTGAGFEIAERFQPAADKALFLVARKP